MKGIRTEPALSVFIANYNHSRFIGQAIDALLNQSIRPGAINIIDDASTDNSRDPILSYAELYPDIIRVKFQKENRGYVNNAIDWLSQDKSEFVFFAAADDITKPELFEQSLAILKRFPDAGLCSALSRLLDENGRDIGPFKSDRPLSKPGFVSPAIASRKLLRDEGWFMGNTTIYRGAALRAVGFDPELGAFADGFACRVVSLRDGACFIPEELAYWRRMSGGMASQAISNPAIVHAIAERTSFLMEETYADLFPRGYARRWRNRWMFSAIIATLNVSPKDRRRTLPVLLKPLAKAAQITLSIIASLPKSCLKISKILAFIYLRPYDVISAISRAFR